MKFSSILLTGVALWLAACKDTPAPETKAASPVPAPAEAPPAAAPAPAFAATDTFKVALGKVFEGYTQIQEALAQDDLPKAKEAFNGMHALLHMMPKEGLDPAAKAYWDSADGLIMESLHPMAATDSIDVIRSNFIAFSVVLIDAIGKLGISTSSPVYQFHCPMAKKNQGADWLQKTKELENPYFGSSMLKCGSLVRTLNG